MKNREIAIKWWDGLSRYTEESPKNSKEFYTKKYYANRFYNTLTGREIEHIWTKEFKFEVGEICFAYYFKIPSSYSEGLELYFCKINSIGDEYANCTLYYGGYYDPSKVKGTFSDVCVDDLKKCNPEDLMPDPKKKKTKSVIKK